MGCTRCGTDTKALQLLTKDLIRQMIDEGKLQEGLVDCQDRRLWREARVVTCDILGDAVCELIKKGELCIDKPEALVYDKDTGELTLVMSDGSTISTTLSPEQAQHLASVEIKGLFDEDVGFAHTTTEKN